MYGGNFPECICKIIFVSHNFFLVTHVSYFTHKDVPREFCWEYFYPSWNYLGEFPIGWGEDWKQKKFPMVEFGATEAFHWGGDFDKNNSNEHKTSGLSRKKLVIK